MGKSKVGVKRDEGEERETCQFSFISLSTLPPRMQERMSTKPEEGCSILWAFAEVSAGGIENNNREFMNFL